MTVFDVFVNDRKLCRAGVGRDGVLNAIVSWVKLTGEAARTARRLKAPTEETRLQVGGLSNDIHRRWPEQMLKTGDRITVAVEAAKTFDPPVREKRRDPKLEEEREKSYYLRLKRKFEGPSRGSSGRARRAVDESETTFLNVDLDIWSKSPLDELVDAFGRKACVLHVGKEGRRYSAHLELAASPRNADQAITRFVGLVEALPRAARALWNRAQIREFNVGIQAGTTPYSYELRLQPTTLLSLARIDARLGVTVYRAGLST
jgi:hypothetical protein